MQASNILDVTNAEEKINSRIDALKTSIDVLKSEKDLKKSPGDSFQKAQENITSQLNKIKDLQKRFQRDPPNSMDQLLGFLGQTRGKNIETLKYLRRKILDTSASLEPKMVAILKEESIKALGCSQEQTYRGTPASTFQLQPLSTIPQGPNDGFLYIPVQSVDFFGNLKNTPDSQIGKVYYEKPDPSADPIFRPFGGRDTYPMNKQLYQLMESSNQGRSMNQILGKDYGGASGQPLFDAQYTLNNGLGISGNFFRVALIDREDNSGNTVNKVGEFISDYYSTIKIVDNVDVTAQLVNIVSQALSIKAEAGFGDLDKQSKFALLVQRILGLCFDNRREIDVSGIAKIGELDGVDESFWEFTEIDLRNIELNIANIQKGVMEFEDCDNVKLPVDVENLVEQLIQFRDSTGSTIEQQIQTSEQILDSISQNPDWNALVPNNFNVGIAINEQVIKRIPLAIAATVLTPKVLLPIFTVMAITQSAATFTYNQVVTSANTEIQSANTFITSANTMQTEIGQEGSNIITSGADFLKKWKTFSIGVLSRINEEFLKTLYDVLKKDILGLIAVILRDVEKSKKLKKYAIIVRLLELTVIVARLINDYKRCKSLLSSILLLLNLINGLGKKALFGNNQDIPIPLLLAASLLPGFSPERATINFIEKLQELGIPTGTLPDGSPNLMLLYNLMTNKSIDEERAANEKIRVVLDSPITAVGKAI
jgi:hypothetical protein